MLKFSANISLLFKEIEFIDRFEKTKQMGFNGVEFQFPYEIKASIIKEKLNKYGLTLSIFNAPPGNFKEGDRGLACLPERKKEYIETINTALEYAKIIKGKSLHVMAGISNIENNINHQKTYIENIKWACDQALKNQIDVLIEPINQRNIPNYFLKSTDLAIELIQKINQPNLKLLFDIFHHQIIRGDIINYIEKYHSYIGHIQIASVPNRNEPDENSEINYKYILKSLIDFKYKGWIGCEYNPLKDTISGMTWMEKYKK